MTVGEISRNADSVLEVDVPRSLCAFITWLRLYEEPLVAFLLVDGGNTLLLDPVVLSRHDWDESIHEVLVNVKGVGCLVFRRLWGSILNLFQNVFVCSLIEDVLLTVIQNAGLRLHLGVVQAWCAVVRVAGVLVDLHAVWPLALVFLGIHEGLVSLK